MLGNKGAVSVSMKIGETRVRFINCHLTAGQAHMRRRSKDIEKVLDSEVIEDLTEGIQICMGDFNFRMREST